MTHWYVLTAAPNREFKAAKRLTTAGFRSYVPVSKKWRRANETSQRKELHSYPLMAGYVFIVCGANPPWHRILSSKHIRGVVKVLDQPVKLRAGEMEILMDREQSGEFEPADAARWMASHREYVVGEDVTIVRGALSGLVGLVERIDAVSHRADLRVAEILGAERVVSVPLESMEAV